MGTDAHVRARLIEEHLPLVHSIARRYAGGPEPLDDLVQAGSVGLIKAVDRFDPARGATLAALAGPAIEGEIRHHLRDRAPLVRVPRGVRELGARVRAAEDELTARDRHAPGAAALADALGVPEAAVAEALLARQAAAGAPLPDDEPAAPDTGADDRAALANAWTALKPRERDVLELRYRDDLSQAAIARRIGRSQAQVSRLLAGGLERLRTAMGAVADPAPETYSGSGMDDPPEATAERPEPARSGRFLVRMPQSLHDALAREAEAEGVSLNTLICNALAGAVSWRDGRPRETGAPEPRPAAPRTSRVLTANLVLVGLVAIAAIVLLVLAATGH
ncbi:MAG: sigma-70 family RNA polymerase sigma factor [Solirubrobacteraceae bacterium]